MKQRSSGPVRVPGNQLETVLGLCWPDTLEAARSGLEGVPLEELPPLDRQQTDVAMEVLKILFNITFDKGRRSVDEVQRNFSAIQCVNTDIPGFPCFYLK